MTRTIFMGIGFFGTIWSAPNGEVTIREGWAIHPFSVFLTLLIVTTTWYLNDVGWLDKPEPRTRRRYHRETRKEHQR